jgi:hypothetical protein
VIGASLLRWPPKPPEALKRDTSRGWAVIQWAEPGFAGVPSHPRRPDVPNRSLKFRSGLVHSLGCLAGHDPATSCSTDSRPPFHGHPLACTPVWVIIWVKVVSSERLGVAGQLATDHLCANPRRSRPIASNAVRIPHDSAGIHPGRPPTSRGVRGVGYRSRWLEPTHVRVPGALSSLSE